MREKLNMPFWQQQLRDEIQPSTSHHRPELKIPPPDLASDATSWDTRQRHAQTHSPPQKHARPVANGDTGRWIVPRDTLVPLGRSLTPRLGGWNVHRDTLVPLGRFPHLPDSQPNPMRVVPMMGPGFQPPGPCRRHEFGIQD